MAQTSLAKLLDTKLAKLATREDVTGLKQDVAVVKQDVGWLKKDVSG